MADDTHVHDESELEEFDTVILTDDEGKEHEFLHLDTLEIDGSTYFIMIPTSDEDESDEDSEDDEADEAVILKLGKDEDGSEVLLDIDDDEEWEKVADAWQSLVDSEE